MSNHELCNTIKCHLLQLKIRPQIWNNFNFNRDRSAVAISVVSAWEISWLVSWLAIYTGINRGQCRDFTYSFTRSLARKDTLFDTIAWLDRGWAFVRMASAKGSLMQCGDGLEWNFTSTIIVITGWACAQMFIGLYVSLWEGWWTGGVYKLNRGRRIEIPFKI